METTTELSARKGVLGGPLLYDYDVMNFALLLNFLKSNASGVHTVCTFP
jgi:hypothetical protein